MPTFGLTRLELELAGLAILAAIFCLWLGFHDSAIKNAATAPVIASIKAAEEAASAAKAVQDAKTDAEQAENLHEANSQNAARAADVRALAGVVDGLRNNAVRPRAAASDPAAAGSGGSFSLSAPDVVSGVLYRRALAALADTQQDAADLAEYADCLVTSGKLCSADYRALTAN